MRRNTHSYSIDRDRIETLSRLIVAAVVAAIIWSAFYYGAGDSGLSFTLVRYGIFLYIFGAAAIGADLWRRPAYSTTRNVLGIALDVSAVSAGLYLAGGIVDPIALFYLWIMLGSGIVYGIRYLLFAGVLAFASFSFVYMSSSYWQSQPMFSATMFGLMLLLGPYLAMLLANLEKARKEVTWQADHDGLTGLLNRSAFGRELEAGWSNTAAEPKSHFLLYMDLDNFKDINDDAGHAAGDQALVDVVKLISATLADTDMAARMGGDEFCLLMLNETTEAARRRAERIRNDVATYRLAWGKKYYKLGISIGVACSDNVSDGDSLVRLADAACYAAKNNGRNQVHVVDSHADVTDTHIIRQLRRPGDAAFRQDRFEMSFS